MFITLENHFHGTSCRVRVTNDFMDGCAILPISASTYRRIRDTLCGAAKCGCGIVTTRGVHLHKDRNCRTGEWEYSLESGYIL